MNPAKTLRAGARFSLLTLPVLAALSTGCGTTAASLRRDGFNHGQYPYVVSYADPAQARLLPEGWRLDNYVPFEAPPATSAADWTVELEPKKGQTLAVAIDEDDDGKVDTHLAIPSFDLKLVHNRTAGVIWLRTFPISAHLREKELRILAQDYIDAVAGVGLTSVQLGPGKVLVEQRRFATRTVSVEPTTIAGHEALAATFEVANVDQIQLAPDARWERARVILVRTPFSFMRELAPRPDLPVLMVVGYENLPADFEAQLPDFEHFLTQIVTRPDDAELQKVAAPMLDCTGDDPMPATLALDDHGAVVGLRFDRDRKDAPLDCVPKVLQQLHLHGTGQARTIRFTFRRSYPLPPRAPTAVLPPAPPAPAAPPSQP